MPVMQLLHVSYAVQPALGFKEVRVLATETCVDNPSSKVLGFEVWVSETDENFE